MVEEVDGNEDRDDGGKKGKMLRVEKLDTEYFTGLITGLKIVF